MTSQAKILANRRNARKSRGPRTAAGKSIASRNAYRHGLAAITRELPALFPDIERMAKALCGDDKIRSCLSRRASLPRTSLFSNVRALNGSRSSIGCESKQQYRSCRIPGWSVRKPISAWSKPSTNGCSKRRTNPPQKARRPAAIPAQGGFTGPIQGRSVSS